MAASWEDRIRTIRDALLTLEVNTVVSDTISAQKMPELPLALHSLVQAYSRYLSRSGFPVTAGLLRVAALHVAGLQDAAAGLTTADRVREQLQCWPFAERHWTEAEVRTRQEATYLAQTDPTQEVADLTNGAETFEAMQWAAWAALQRANADQAYRARCDPSVLTRIFANCRQVKMAAVRLEQQASDRPDAAAARLRTSLAATDGGGATDAATPFGRTAEATTRALFDGKAARMEVDPDITIMVRKAWDLGTAKVRMQTVMQVDGDIMQVFHPSADEDGPLVMQMHKDAVRESLGQWRVLFGILAEAARTFAGALRGR
ncbi:MAG: hypothetical protein JSS43_07280 [Proteobacteria bacterium]|nr:hypothetical protein [Pseudomonadota bacterium]